LEVGQLKNTFDNGLTLFAFYAKGRREKRKLLEDFEVVINAHKIRHISNQSADLFAVPADVQAIDEGFASSRFQKRNQNTHRGSFAGTIGTDETEYVTVLNGQIQVVNGG